MKLEEIAKTADQLHAFYRLRFAGRPRVTRNAEVAERLAADAARLRAAAVQANAPEEVTSRLEERAELYAKEAELVRGATAQASEAEREAAEIAQRAALLDGAYARHFAYQSRLTRDEALLAELIEDLNACRASLEEIKPELSDEAWEGYSRFVFERLKMLGEERAAIQEAIRGADAATNASRLASVANAQFAMYRHQFAGKSRLSRRPALLERMIRCLQEIHEAMSALHKGGYESEDNVGNMAIVRERMEAFEKELEAIREARSSASLDQLVGAFGQEANGLMETWDKVFAGKPRKEVSLETMAALCDGMTEAMRQSDDLDQRVEHEANRRNLELMRDFTWMLQQEYLAIAEAQREGASSAGA